MIPMLIALLVLWFITVPLLAVAVGKAFAAGWGDPHGSI
jgi:hypothetical protein